MILLVPANTILYGLVENLAADHLINGLVGNFDISRLKPTRYPDCGFLSE